jgi:phosphoribosylformylglycinamidine synthase
MTAKVFVTLKKSVLDPQGQAVQRSLATLGFPEVESVRMGKYFEVQLAAKSRDAALQRIDEMCRKLLANTVIEDWRVEIVE